jgi:hypothetical protein
LVLCKKHILPGQQSYTQRIGHFVSVTRRWEISLAALLVRYFRLRPAKR